MTDPLQAALDRISARVAARAADRGVQAGVVRASLPDGLRVVAEGLRDRFGAKLLYLETQILTRGDVRHMAQGIVPVETARRRT